MKALLKRYYINVIIIYYYILLLFDFILVNLIDLIKEGNIIRFNNAF